MFIAYVDDFINIAKAVWPSTKKKKKKTINARIKQCYAFGDFS